LSRSRSSAAVPTRWRAGSPERSTTPEWPALIVIAGATATGKTALALELAARLEGTEVISADSRQVYRGLDIGTAKPTPAERAAVPHHCLDLVDPAEAFTASDYRRAAQQALVGIASRGGLALLVGGTGLYLRGVARGLPLERTGADAAVRAALEARLAEGGLGPLVAQLLGHDAAAAEDVDLRNPRRVVRALERALVTGSATPPRPEGYPAPLLWLGLAREPSEHRRAIVARVEAQFAAGLLHEAAQLRERHPEELPAFTAMGYREAFDVLADRCDVEQAKAADAHRTWAYARRQRTWFRSEPDIRWLEVGEGLADRALEALTPFLREIGRGGYADVR
jgi:tRNA dimethylallyltransferase